MKAAVKAYCGTAYQRVKGELDFAARAAATERIGRFSLSDQCLSLLDLYEESFYKQLEVGHVAFGRRGSGPRLRFE